MDFAMALKLYMLVLMRSVVVFFFAISLISPLANSQAILGFQEWKLGQINVAKNQSVRASNQFLMSVRREDSRRLQNRYQREARYRAQALEITKDLSIEDYLNQYILKMPHPHRALKQVSMQMPRAEVYKLLQSLLESKSSKKRHARAQLQNL